MAKITVEDDSKVMDVAKPGKGKIMTTSRPVFAPITSDGPKKDDVSATLPDSEVTKPLAPSATKKIIQPLSAAEETPEETPEPEAADEAAEEAPVEAAAETPEATPKEEAEKPEEPSPSEDKAETSDGASVDAVAGTVGSKKEAIKKAEEQAKRDAAVQELIDSKKYVVPIGHEGPKTRRTGGHHSALWLVPLLLIIAAVAAAYLLIDAGIIKSSLTLPFDLIK